MNAPHTTKGGRCKPHIPPCAGIELSLCGAMGPGELGGVTVFGVRRLSGSSPGGPNLYFEAWRRRIPRYGCVVSTLSRAAPTLRLKAR